MIEPVETHTLSETILSLSTLTLLEIVLGIDNLVIISILSEKLPQHQKSKARKVGLALALITRILLLTTLTWLAHLTTPLFTAFNTEISTRDLVLLLGGLFLFLKAAKEIYKFTLAKDLDDQGPDLETRLFASHFVSVVAMIIFFDIVFSFDSVLTAVGLAKQLWVMITAVVVAIIFMLIFVDQVCDFIEQNPMIKLLGLAFLIMIGLLLIAEGIHHHIQRNLIYFAMAFSICIEILGFQRNKIIKKRASR